MKPKYKLGELVALIHRSVDKEKTIIAIDFCTINSVHLEGKKISYGIDKNGGVTYSEDNIISRKTLIKALKSEGVIK